jgi:LPS sulfotransferase NodH
MTGELSIPRKHFVVVAHPRSGSTLLQEALRQHPDIQMFGELLHDNVEARKRDLGDRGIYYRGGSSAAQFLERVVFGEDEAGSARAVGFKLFYGHARMDDAAREAWQLLTTRKDIYIVHMVRRNLLDSFVSLKVAIRTNEWACLIEAARKPSDVEPFAVAARECRSFFDNVTRDRRMTREVFMRPRYMEVTYDALASGYLDRVNSVVAFLGLSPFRPCHKLVKQATKTPREQLSNYEELERAFRNTQYACFFG